MDRVRYGDYQGRFGLSLCLPKGLGSILWQLFFQLYGMNCGCLYRLTGCRIVLTTAQRGMREPGHDVYTLMRIDDGMV